MERKNKSGTNFPYCEVIELTGGFLPCQTRATEPDDHFSPVLDFDGKIPTSDIKTFN
jgi:hypothetical protein